MKRGGFIRRDLEKAREWLARKVPIIKRNAKRAKQSHAEDFGPPGYVEHVHGRGCLVARTARTTKGCLGSPEAAHVVPRSRGGLWRDNLVCLCTAHHREAHTLGHQTFEKKHRLDMDLEACVTTHRWDIR